MFALAWKNTLFYRGRSITTFVLTFISTLFFILYVALMDGSHNSMLENALKVYTGAIEIYKKEYREVGGNEYLITDVARIEKGLSEIEGIHSFGSRYETYGLLSSKELSSASMVAGVSAHKERELSQLHEALIEGVFLEDEPRNSIYIGAGLAQKLQVGVGDELAFIGSASDNSFAADLFRVCGIFRTGSFEFDMRSAFVSRSYFDGLMQADNKASYITIQVERLSEVERINGEIARILEPDHESLSWKILMKPMVELMQVDSIFGYVSISLFFIVIFFVVMIFGFINVSSRVREFGTLRCIGISKADIRTLLFYEMLILSSSAVVLAAPVGAYLSYYFSLNPIVIEGMSEMYKEYSVVSDEVPLNFDPLTISWNVGVIYLVNFLSIIYPTHYINAFRPIEASRHV